MGAAEILGVQLDFQGKSWDGSVVSSEGSLGLQNLPTMVLTILPHPCLICQSLRVLGKWLGFSGVLDVLACY